MESEKQTWDLVPADNHLDNLIGKEVSKKEILRMELNFLKLPLFTMDKKKVGAKQSLAIVLAPKVIDGIEEQVRYAICPPLDLGLGGPFDYAAFRAVEFILSEMYAEKGVLTNPIPLGRGHRILKLMGEKVNGKSHKALITFFKRMRKTTMDIDHSVYDKVKRRWYESFDGDFIYRRVILTGEKMPDGGGRADQIYLWLSDLYMSNLNASFIKLIDYSLYKELKLPTSRRFFEILSVYAYKHRSVRINYSELCLRVPLKRYNMLSLAKRIISKPLQELIEKKLLETYEFIPIPGKSDGWRDWQVKFVFGASSNLFNVESELEEEDFDASGVLEAMADNLHTKKVKKKEPAKIEHAKEHEKACKEILSYLSAKTGKDYSNQLSDSIPLIAGWMQKGKVIADFKKVIDNMAIMWLHDAKMSNYLRPATLFGRKMQEYLNFTTQQAQPSNNNQNKYANLGTVVYVDDRKDRQAEVKTEGKGTHKNQLRDKATAIMLRHCGVSKRHCGASLSDFALSAIQSDWDFLTDSFFITGERGLGKTHLAVAIIRHKVENLLSRQSSGSDSRIPIAELPMFVSVPELVRELAESRAIYKHTDTASDSTEILINKYSKVKTLVLDDIKTEEGHKGWTDDLYLILDKRYRDNRRTIITTTLSLDEIAQRLSDNIASRIADMCRVMTLIQK